MQISRTPLPCAVSVYVFATNLRGHSACKERHNTDHKAYCIQGDSHGPTCHRLVTPLGSTTQLLLCDHQISSHIPPVLHHPFHMDWLMHIKTQINVGFCVHTTTKHRIWIQVLNRFGRWFHHTSCKEESTHTNVTLPHRHWLLLTPAHYS